ncbi:MAG: hypothetical protein E7166_06270 [Firmicutes bacterium]|nr:hypothetical protein [Bacillota bacterium]
MKINKTLMIILTSIITVYCIYTGFNIVNNTLSTDDTVSNKLFVENVNKLNNILKEQNNTNNTNFISEILDKDGNVPAYSYYKSASLTPSRAINDLKAYDDKIFMGLGDYDANTGPVKIIYYDTKTEEIVSSGTLPDEEVLWFNLFNDKIYTTGADPKEDWGYGSYYTYNKETNLWDQHLFNDGWIHVYDVEKINDDVFMCGSVNTSSKSTIQISKDNGNTFTPVELRKDGTKIGHSSDLRCYNVSGFNGDAYAFVYNGKTYSGIYKYDKENNIFNHISASPPYISFENVVTPSIFHNFMHFTTTTYKDTFLYVAGSYMYKINVLEDDKISFTNLTKNLQYAVVDTVTIDDVFYLLTYQYDSNNKMFKTNIYTTTDLTNYKLFYSFTIDALPFTMEYHNNKLYVGTGYYENAIVERTGALYKIDLNMFENNLKLNNENKTIDITKDGVKYPVNFNEKDNNFIFETTLTFEKNMTKTIWQQEYTKFKNLNLMYTLVDDPQNINLDNSVAYYDDVINNYITESTNENENAIEFAKSIFKDGETIKDDRFNINFDVKTDNEDKYEVSVTLTVPNIRTITSSKYLIDDENNYIYIGKDKNVTTIEKNITKQDFIKTNIDLDNNKLTFTYNDTVIKEYKIIRFTTTRRIVNNYIYMSNFDDNKILNNINVINADEVIDGNKLQIKYKDKILDEYNIIKFSTNQSLIYKNIYVGIFTDEEILSSINVINGNAIIEDNKIRIKHGNITVDTLNIIKIITDQKIVDKYIYMNNFTDEESLTKINITNGEATIENDKLQIKYNNNILDEYDIVRYTLGDINVMDNMVYIGNNKTEEIEKELKVINAEGTIFDDRIEISKNNVAYDTINLLKINFNILKENKKTVLIPEEYSYKDLMNTIVSSKELSLKIFKNDNEITSGNIDADMKLKVYYNDIELDNYDFILEHLKFDNPIMIENNLYLTNIYANTKVSELLNRISTSGDITIKNNKNEVISNKDLLVGTGVKVSIKLTTKTKEYTIIIKGDINSDGIVDLKDIIKMSNYIYIDKNNIGEEFLNAIDYDDNGKHNLSDIMKAAKTLIGGN